MSDTEREALAHDLEVVMQMVLRTNEVSLDRAMRKTISEFAATIAELARVDVVMSITER